MTDIVVDPLRAPITRPHTHIHRHTVWVTRGALYYCIVLDWMWAKINWHADFILFIIWQINRKSWDRRESPLVPVRSPLPSSSFVQPCKLLSGVCVYVDVCYWGGSQTTVLPYPLDKLHIIMYTCKFLSQSRWDWRHFDVSLSVRS